MSAQGMMRAKKAVDLLSEEEALDIAQYLRARFGWSMTLFTVRDCWVERGGLLYSVGEADDDGEITEGMREALRADRYLSGWLEEALTEQGNRLLPTLVIAEDGSYDVRDAD